MIVDKNTLAAESAMRAAVAAAEAMTANQALGDGELLKLIFELFKTLLPILLEQLGG